MQHKSGKSLVGHKQIAARGLEMMDKATIDAVERFQPCGYPSDAATLVIVELDGTAAEVDSLVDVVEQIARAEGATTTKVSTSEAERLRFWAGRKNAFPAVSCIGPDYLCMDGTIPRGKLPEVLTGMEALAREHGLRVANVFHAGADGGVCGRPRVRGVRLPAWRMGRAGWPIAIAVALCLGVTGIFLWKRAKARRTRTGPGAALLEKVEADLPDCVTSGACSQTWHGGAWRPSPHLHDRDGDRDRPDPPWEPSTGPAIHLVLVTYCCNR